MRASGLFVPAVFALLCSCDPGATVEITETREIAGSPSVPRVAASPEERFGIRQHPFTWETPATWQAAETSQFRLLNYRIAENTECYVTVLPGGGGGVGPNLDRWRAQMGLEPAGEDALTGLELKPFLGTEAYAISLDGDFQGMNNKSGKAYRLLGLIQQFSGILISAKMVGPVEEVATATQDFYEFCESIRFRKQ